MNKQRRGKIARRRLDTVSLAALALAICGFGQALASTRHILPIEGGAPVVGEPFSAVRTLDYQPRANASDPQPFHAEQTTYRDSQGRTRYETRYPSQSAMVVFRDPVARRVCHWIQADTVAMCSTIKGIDPLASPKFVENLHADAPIVEGVATRHTRSTKDLPDKGLQTIETWYAPSLHLALVTIIDTPGEGTTTYRFQHLKLDEPDASLFRVPDGMKIEDGNTPPPPPVAVSSPSNSPSTQGNYRGPKVVYSVEPDFSDEARKAVYGGIVMISLTVDTEGFPQNVRVTRPLGKGLDEKAVEAVRQYQFEPATVDGKPVSAQIAIQVRFSIYKPKR